MNSFLKQLVIKTILKGKEGGDTNNAAGYTYTATVESRPLEYIVIMRATVLQLTRIEMTFVLKSAGDWTTIEETISIKSPLPFKSIILNIFKEQHNQLFKNMSEVNHTPRLLIGDLYAHQKVK